MNLKVKIILICALAIYTVGITAQTPYDGRTHINQDESFVVLADTEVGALTINDGGKLIINYGIELTVSGIININGELVINSGGGLNATGSLVTGHGATSDTKITLSENSFIAVSGAWTQYNPTGGEADVYMADNSAIEVCGPFSQFKTSSPYVHYTGSDLHAYFVNKTSASGTGINELGDHENIIWIATGQVANLIPGEASFYGPNATQDQYPDIWPSGLKGHDPRASTCHTIDLESNNPLPVTLLSFNAYSKKRSAVLNWATATEINNAGFSVESSTNGKVWKEIGFVKSKAINGSSNSKINYQFTTMNTTKGVNYYRLRQVDLDGAESFSEIRKLRFGSFEDVRIFPNPAQSFIQVNGLDGDETVSLYNTSGILVKNKVNIGQNVLEISLDNLQSGVYFLKIISADGNTSFHEILKY